MKRDEIEQLFISLAKSQGLYGRILNVINNEMDADDLETFWQNLESQNFKDSIDVIMFIEC